MTVIRLLLAIIVAYLLGSIPVGLIMSKLQAKIDIRDYGSGRTGGTNVLRTLGRKAFVIVAAGDLLKAAAAVMLGGLIMGDRHFMIGNITVGYEVTRAIAGICAIMGHIFPIFAHFRGGRGVATFIGGLAAICTPAALFGGEILIIGAGISGFASLGSLISVFSAYFIMILFIIIYDVPLAYMIYAFFGTVIIIIAHRDNIKRLLAGKERKLHQKATPQSDTTT